jgi:thiol-disulfide isomerase/thioredoxin
MPIRKVEFADLEERVESKARPVLDLLAPKMGKAYVIAITRDGCPACEKQKPLLDKLAEATVQRHGDAVAFVRIHISYTPQSQEESKRSKALLGHYFYPTNLILFRTHDRGAIEYYRNASPTMSELRKSIDTAVKIAQMLEKEKP